MTENYVTFQIAELLKGLGFDAQCRAFYKKWNGIITLFDCDKSQMLDYCNNTTLAVYTDDEGELNIAAPTVQMANQFLREKYHLRISIGFINYGYSWHIINCEYGNCYSHGQKGGFKTAEDANLDALNICLTDIIK
jgi:hypothetical protein